MDENKLNNDENIDEKKESDEKKLENTKELVEEELEELEELLSQTKDFTDEDIEEKVPSKKYAALILLLFILLLLGFFLIAIIYVKVTNYNKKEPDIEEKEETDVLPPIEDPIKDEEKKHELSIYYNDGIYTTEKNDQYELIVTIPTEDEESVYFDITRNSNNEKKYHVLYKDNDKLKIYDVENKASSIISLSAKYEKYELIHDDITNKLYGIAYYSDIVEGTSSPIRNTSGFFNIKTGKILYKNLYDEFYYVSEDKIAGKETIDTSETIHELLSNAKEKKYQKVTGTNTGYFEEQKENKNYIIYNHNPGIRNLYTKNGLLISENIERYMYEFDNYNNVMVIKNKKVEKYTPEGMKIAESKEYDNVLQLINDFFVVSLNGKLVITNFNDLEVILGTWLDHYTYFLTNSGYMKENDLCNDMQEGIYIAIDNKEAGVLYYYNPETNEIKEFELPHTTCKNNENE